MALKPQDIYVLLKMVVLGHERWSYGFLADELGMSPSQVHSAVKRSMESGLAVKSGDSIRPNISALKEFLAHGVRYAFAPQRGEMTRGTPTAHAAPVAKDMFLSDSEPPPVWPDANGQVRGIGFSPIYKAAPRAARNDPKFYDMLALVDMIRGGRAREKAYAVKELSQRMDECA